MSNLKVDSSAALLSSPFINNIYGTAGVDTVTGAAGNDTEAAV